MVLKRSETTDLSIILSNFRMFWHSFYSKSRRSIGLEPILTRKLASLPQNLFCHNPLRETKNFRTVKNILSIYSSSQGSTCPFNTIAGFPLVGGGTGGISPTSQNFGKSPLTKSLSLPINVPLHLVWHSLPSISQSPPII